MGNGMNFRTLLPVLVLTTFVLLGCSTTPDAPAQVAPPDIEATVEAKVMAVLTAVPTATPTPYPTYTPVLPAATQISPTLIPTATQVQPTPTATAIPTHVPPTLTAELEELYNPDDSETAAANPPQETQISDQQNAATEKQEAMFWNERPSGFPDCAPEFKFSHQFANPEDVVHMFFSEGGHIEPHEHMLYWSTESAGNVEGASGETRYFSRKIQLYAPTDIYRVNLGYSNRLTEAGDKYVEWGGYLYTCNGHQLMLGHIGEPSDEMLAVLAGAEPFCDDDVETISHKPEPGCHWRLDTFIPSGTPIFKNSGYTGAFDFGLELSGLTLAELQEQPGYGYSVTPWRVGSGRAVCPLEYFPEPLRSEYLKRLFNDLTEQQELLECGPFNQDVPGTAMGFWMPSPSPNNPPLDPSERGFGEWDTIWLSESNKDPSVHVLSVGDNTFGLDYGGYHIVTASAGLVNRRWDAIKPGHTYCAEFIEVQNEESASTLTKVLIMRLSEDGLDLTVEAITGDKCGDGPWTFQERERTFYR